MNQQKTILIVEDEFDFAKMMKMRLESAGFHVVLATDAYSGTQAVIQSNPDLIVLDLMMPAGGGFSLLDRIRKIPAKAMIPVVIVTGKTIDEELKNQARDFRVSAIFAKPYNSQIFVQKISSLLSKSSMEAVG